MIELFVLLLVLSEYIVSGQVTEVVPYDNEPKLDQCSIAASGWSKWMPQSCQTCGQSRFRYCQGTYRGCGEWYCMGGSTNYCDGSCPPLVILDPRATPSTGELTCGTKVTFTCPTCYRTGGSHVTECMVNKVWTRDPPICKHITCPEPHNITNGFKIWGPNCMSTAKYRCYTGYELIGPEELTCTESGRWLPAELPLCIPKKCPHITPPRNGIIMIFSRSYRARAYFRCRMGYDMVGPRSVRCGSTGFWSASSPACIRNKFSGYKRNLKTSNHRN